MGSGPKSGVRLRGNDDLPIPLFPEDGDFDELLVERIRVFYQRVAGHLRELEAYKLKRGYCVGGMSCTRKAVPSKTSNNGKGRICAHHQAASKAGIKLRRWQAYESEYGRLRREQIEAEREAKAEAEGKVRKQTTRPRAAKRRRAA